MFVKGSNSTSLRILMWPLKWQRNASTDRKAEESAAPQLDSGYLTGIAKDVFLYGGSSSIGTWLSL